MEIRDNIIQTKQKTLYKEAREKTLLSATYPNEQIILLITSDNLDKLKLTNVKLEKERKWKILESSSELTKIPTHEPIKETVLKI